MAPAVEGLARSRTMEQSRGEGTFPLALGKDTGILGIIGAPAHVWGYVAAVLMENEPKALEFPEIP